MDTLDEKIFHAPGSEDSVSWKWLSYQNPSTDWIWASSKFQYHPS